MLFLWLKFSFSKRFWKKKGGGVTASLDTRKRQVLGSLWFKPYPQISPQWCDEQRYVRGKWGRHSPRRTVKSAFEQHHAQRVGQGTHKPRSPFCPLWGVRVTLRYFNVPFVAIVLFVLKWLKNSLYPHAWCYSEGSAERRQDCEYNLKNLFPSFFLHNFLVFLVINNVLDYRCKGTTFFLNHQKSPCRVMWNSINISTILC